MTVTMDDYRVVVTGSGQVPDATVSDIVHAYWGTSYYGRDIEETDANVLLVRFNPESEEDRAAVHRGVQRGMKVLVLGSDGILPVEAVPAPVVIPTQRKKPQHHHQPVGGTDLLRQMGKVVIASGQWLSNLADQIERPADG